MNSKQLIIQTLNGEATERPPVTLHGWGLYKFAMAGVIRGYEDEANAWALTGQGLADIEAQFYEAFRPDTLHVGTSAAVTAMDEKKAAEIARLAVAVKKLESKAVIDEYLALITPTQAEVLASGEFSHVPILAEKYGDAVFITLNEGNPLADTLDPHGLLGFEDGLMSLIEAPEMVAYLLYGLYEAKLERMRALKASGADAYIGSETYCSADIISPAAYESVVLPAQQRFYRGLKEIGLYSITYFLGDLYPMMPAIKRLGIDAMLVESWNKAVELKIDELYEQIDGAFTLFGNLNSADLLLNGTPQAVAAETQRQLAACSGAQGRFIMSNDCPISFGTPVENIKAMLETARKF